MVIYVIYFSNQASHENIVLTVDSAYQIDESVMWNCFAFALSLSKTCYVAMLNSARERSSKIM